MSGSYAGPQIVGMDLHRRRSVLVRMTETGEQLETVRISNDRDYLREVMARAGEAPEVVLEATYGWYWAADTLRRARRARSSGASVGGEDVLPAAGQERSSATPRTWPIYYGWAGCPRRGSLHRRRGSCAAGCATAPSWSGCARSLQVPGPRRARRAPACTVPMSDLFGPSGQKLLAAARSRCWRWSPGPGSTRCCG